MNKQKHLNLEARILIETMLNEHHSFKSIARELGKRLHYDFKGD